MPLFWLGPLLQLAGVALIIWTARVIGWQHWLGRPRTGPALLLHGPYRFVRHPGCTGVLVMLIGLLLRNPGWPSVMALLAGVAGMAIWIGASEARNVVRFGEAYRRYQKAVPAVLPLRLR